MRTSRRHQLPLQPLLHAFLRLPAPQPDRPSAAIASARADFLSPLYLASTPDKRLLPHLERFYAACVDPPLHSDVLRKRLGFVRHGLVHMVSGTDPLHVRFGNCVAPGGPYHVPGLGPRFWSALAQALRPTHHPAWTSAILTGLRRLGLDTWSQEAGPGLIYAAMLSAYSLIQALDPGLTAQQINCFLTLVAHMRGRRLETATASDPTGEALGRLRQQEPLRDRLCLRGHQLAEAQAHLQAALAQGDGKALGLALAAADPDSVGRSPLDWGEHADRLNEWISQLWESESPEMVLRAFWREDPLPGAGLWLPTAVLHLRDPQQFIPYGDAVRRGLAALDDCAAWTREPADAYQLACGVALWLRQKYTLHPLEVPALLTALAPEPIDTDPGPVHPSANRFDGFCPDTFAFLADLAQNNRRDWMESQRVRYRFIVRQPLVELCQALASRYIEPVLGGVHGWRLDTVARTGRALTSICRNSYGQGDPYTTTLWITFCRSGRADVQFFVRLDASGLRYGLRIGRKAWAAATCFRHNVQRHADNLWQALVRSGATADCLFGQADDGSRYALAGPEALWQWGKGRSFEISLSRPADDPLLLEDDLVGDILLTFDRLRPAFACAVEADPTPFFTDRKAAQPRYDGADFDGDTGLDANWLRHIRHLLDLKSQLILQGVPGTGKTHVVRCLARWLTGGCDEAVRLVQLHPAYSYEEFVEGVKVRTVDVAGRPEATYPIEDGVLLAFAAQAAQQPAQPHVLIIDEINRGNLPRLFGELLYLLEYREQAVQLPCSRREFRLPANLYLLATMNAADRSVVRLDHALRRRFSLVTMSPDARILSRWLMEHEPSEGPLFARRVLNLFERLNAGLLRDVGPHGQVGHSYFMVADLNEERLRMIWQHHVAPLIDEHLARRPELQAAYELEALLEESPRRRRSAASLQG